MRKWIAVLILLGSCTVAPMMTSSDFGMIAVGVEIQHVENIYGEPFDVNELPNRNQEYRYLQRFGVGSDRIEQVEYVFEVHNGNIVSKQCRQVTSSFLNSIQ